MGRISYHVIVVAPEAELNLIENLTDPLATELPEHIQVYKTDTPDLPMGVVDGLQSNTEYLVRSWPYDDFGPGIPTRIGRVRPL